jgi:hypothetical protein
MLYKNHILLPFYQNQEPDSFNLECALLEHKIFHRFRAYILEQNSWTFSDHDYNVEMGVLSLQAYYLNKQGIRFNCKEIAKEISEKFQRPPPSISELTKLPSKQKSDVQIFGDFMHGWKAMFDSKIALELRMAEMLRKYE